MRELIRRDVVSKTGRVGVSPWSDLSLNLMLYIPFSVFAYSSNIFITSLDLMGSIGDLEVFQVFLEYPYIQGQRSRDETDLSYHPSRVLHCLA